MKLIMHCVRSSRLSLIWNGTKLNDFEPSRGLRQGDPMSPYLFVLCMEKLSVMINNKVAEGLWKPIRICRTGPGISHLLFADDVLLFCNGKKSQVRLVMEIMQNFCNMSGLSINLEKSKAMASKGLSSRKKTSLANFTSIHFTGDIGKYLRVPLLKGRVTKAIFQPILDCIGCKLVAWKRSLLNKVGRVCLTKSVIVSLPVYTMQTLWFPQGICSKIDSLTRNFI